MRRTGSWRRHPDHGILGEEFGSHLPDARYRWVLDPIDGTKAFVTGTYLFGTLIALVKDGRPAFGVISQPIIGDFLLGTLDGAWLNGLPVSAPPLHRAEDAILLRAPNTGMSSIIRTDRLTSRRRAKVKRYNNWGDCRLSHLVATGGAHHDGPIMNEWDLMALIPIIEGAAGASPTGRGSDRSAAQQRRHQRRPARREVIRALNGIS